MAASVRHPPVPHGLPVFAACDPPAVGEAGRITSSCNAHLSAWAPSASYLRLQRNPAVVGARIHLVLPPASPIRHRLSSHHQESPSPACHHCLRCCGSRCAACAKVRGLPAVATVQARMRQHHRPPAKTEAVAVHHMHQVHHWQQVTLRTMMMWVTLTTCAPCWWWIIVALLSLPPQCARRPMPEGHPFAVLCQCQTCPQVVAMAPCPALTAPAPTFLRPRSCRIPTATRPTAVGRAA